MSLQVYLNIFVNIKPASLNSNFMQVSAILWNSGESKKCPPIRIPTAQFEKKKEYLQLPIAVML